MKKTVQILFVSAVLLLLAGLSVLTLFFPQTQPGEYDVWENRTLAEKPVLSRASLSDGSYFRGIDDYLSDHLYGRTDILRCNVRCRMLLGNTSVNGVVLGKHTLMNDNGIYDRFNSWYRTASELMASRLAAIRDATEECGGTFVFVGVPSQRNIFCGEYPGYLNSGNEQTENTVNCFIASLEKKDIPSVFPTFTQSGVPLTELYSAVDHHFTLKGAYLCCNEVIDALNAAGCDVKKTEPDRIGFEQLPNPMLGTYNRRLYGCSEVTDHLWIYHSEDAVPYERWDNGKKTDTPLIVLPQSEEDYVTYSAYMEGDKAETVIKTYRPELKKLLIVGDSFTNAMEPLLYMSFDEMRSLDFRYYTEKTLTEYIADYQPDVVLIVRDASVYVSLDGNGDLH